MLTINNIPVEKYWGKGLFKALQAQKFDVYAVYFSDAGIAYLSPLIERAVELGEIKLTKEEKRFKEKDLNSELLDAMNF